jgi:hypothetical protein
MRTKLLIAVAMLLAVPALAAPPAPSIKVGQVLDDTLGKTVNGWEHTQGSMFTSFEFKNGVQTGKLDCCIAVFRKARSFMVALTEPVARNKTGGVIKEKVLAVLRIDLRPGEEEMSCGLFSLQIILSVKNPKTNWVRSVIVDQSALGMLEWRDTKGQCGIDEP